jgi:hypothetical protein
MKNAILFLLFLITPGINNALAQDSYENPLNHHRENIKGIHMPAYTTGKLLSVDKLSFGIKGGVNFSLIIPLSRNSIFSGPDAESYDKEYRLPFKNTGYQMGFILQYDLNKILKISIQPANYNYTYKYLTTYNWQGNTSLSYHSEFAHHIKYFDLPLIAGFYMTYRPWQPYFQAGIFYGRITDATSYISVRETTSSLAGSEQINEYLTTSGSGNLYKKNQYGILGGAGISYLAGNTRISLEANYRVMLSNLNTVESQYNNNQVVSGNYDVPDSFKFSNLEISLQLLIPFFCKATSSRGSSVFCE